MSVLRDDFAGAFNSSLYAKTETAGTVTQTGGEIIFTGSGGGGICYVEDQATADISAGEDYAIKMSGTTPAYPCRMWIAMLDSAGRGIAMRFGGTGVNLFQVGTCTAGIGTFSSISNFGDFDIAVHVFMRVRYASGTGYFDYKTNPGDSYTNRTSTAMPGGFDPTTVKGSFGQYESDSSDVYKVTEYYGPAISGGGGGGSVTTEKFAVFGLAARLKEIEDEEIYRRSLGSFQIGGIVFLSSPLRPVMKQHGLAKRLQEDEDIAEARNRIAFRQISPSTLSPPPSGTTTYHKALLLGLEYRLQNDIDAEEARNRIAFRIIKPRIFPNNASANPEYPYARLFGLQARLAEELETEQNRTKTYFARRSSVKDIATSSVTPIGGYKSWFFRLRRLLR